MRLIDADALVWKIKTEKGGTPAMLVAVNSIPTVDAVPVVRCEDCKFGEKGRIFDSDCIWCGAGSHQEAKSMRFYCASGERREE